jgi:ABC-type transport system substrate-binding protein
VDERRLDIEESLSSRCPAPPGRGSSTQRRTAAGLSCGVFLFSGVLLTGCTSKIPASVTANTQLTIGFPEGRIEGTDLGSKWLASTLSVEGLTQLTDDGKAAPKLAESWWWAKEGRELNLNLRAGIQFHDGTPLTAALASQILASAIAVPSNRSLYSSFEDVISVKPAGDRQLVFELSHPSALLPDDLELPLTHGKSTTGTGPYRVVNDDPNELVLERFPHYYLGSPNIARVTIRPFDTLRTAWTSLLRGNVDMVTDVPPDAVEFIRNDEVRVVSFGRRYQYVLALNLKKRPFNSPLVRRALNAAIDRQALIQNALQGHGVPSTGPLWPKHWAYNTSVAAYRFDPGLAVSLFNSAGLRTDKTSVGPLARFRFTCLIPENYNVLERVALDVQKQLYDVGVDMQFEVVPSKQFNSRIREGRFDAMLIDSISGPTVGRSYMFWRSAQRLPGGLNVFGYENPEAERLFDLIRTSTNEIAVQSAFSRLQEALLDDPPAVFLAWNERSRAVRRNFQIVQDPRSDPSDPVYSMWRWTAAADPTLALAR